MPDHCSAGDTSSPSQVWRAGIDAPGANAGELRVSVIAASLPLLPRGIARASAIAAMDQRRPGIIAASTGTSSGYYGEVRGYSVWARHGVRRVEGRHVNAATTRDEAG